MVAIKKKLKTKLVKNAIIIKPGIEFLSSGKKRYTAIVRIMNKHEINIPEKKTGVFNFKKNC